MVGACVLFALKTRAGTLMVADRSYRIESVGAIRFARGAGLRGHSHLPVRWRNGRRPTGASSPSALSGVARCARVPLVSELRELFAGDPLDYRVSVDLFVGDYVRDGSGGHILLDPLAIEILAEAALRGARAQHLRARVLLGEFLVVEQPVIDKTADRVVRVRRRVFLLDQFSVQRLSRVRAR